MATTNNINTPPTEPAEPTEAERVAKQVVSDADLALNRLANSIQTGFQLVWGTKEQPKEKEQIQEIITALGADVVPVFTRHAAIIAMLEAEDMATFEPWEKVAAYSVGEDLILGEMNPEWIQTDPQTDP